MDIKPDWQKIKDDKTFQRLINDLFFLELHSSFGFNPSSPYIGADGGWDGKFEGVYPLENKKGIFCIQAKYTKYNNNEALKALKSVIKSEFDKAESNKVDHLRLATNAELNQAHVDELKSLALNSSFTFDVWHCENLNQRILMQPFVRYSYFDYSAILAFVPQVNYFETIEPDVFSMRFSISEHVDAIREVKVKFKDFLENDRKVFLLHAIGGYGKSHILKELPDILMDLNDEGFDREVWFIKDIYSDEAFQREIGARKSCQNIKYLLFLDDADRLANIDSLLSYIKSSGLDIKLVLSARTSGLSLLEDKLHNRKLYPYTEVVPIRQWKKAEFQLLLEKVVGRKLDDIKDGNFILRDIDNPYFIIQIARSLKKSPEYNFDEFKSSIVNSIILDAQRISDREIQDKEFFVFILSLLVPIDLSMDDLDELCALFSIKMNELKKNVRLLCENGVLRNTGGEIFRFSPDMKGDIFLMEEIQNRQRPSLVEENILRFIEKSPNNIFCNLGTSLRYSRKNALIPLLESIVDKWKQSSNTYTVEQKRKILNYAKNIAFFVPEKIYHLLLDFAADENLSQYAYKGVVERLSHSKIERYKIIYFLSKIKKLEKGSVFDDGDVLSMVRESISPIKHDIETKLIPFLEYFKKNISAIDNSFVEIILSEILAASHAYNEMVSDYQMSYGHRCLGLSEDVKKMRRDAIQILKNIFHDTSLRYIGIKVLKNITNDLYVQHDKNPLYEILKSERQEMACYIYAKKILEEDTNYFNLVKWVDLLIAWWSHKSIDDESLIQCIEQVPESPEYRILSRCIASYHFVKGIDVLNYEVANRWKWFCENINTTKKYYFQKAEYEGDVKSLNSKYDTAINVLGFLKLFETYFFKNTSGYVKFFSCLKFWIEINPEIFKKLKVEHWAEVPSTFKRTILVELAKKYKDIASETIESFLRGDFSEEDNEIAIDILFNSANVEGVLLKIKSVLIDNDDDTNLYLFNKFIDNAGDSSPKEISKIILLFFNNFKQSSFKSAVIRRISFYFYNKDENIVNQIIEAVKLVFIDALLSFKELSYDDCSFLKYLLSDISDVVTFLEERFKREISDKTYQYHAVPFKGIADLQKFISDESKYLTFAKKVASWHPDYQLFSLSQLLEQVMTMKTKDGNLYILRDSIKEEFTENEDDLTLFINLLRYIDLSDDTKDLFVSVVEKCLICDNLLESIKSLLYRKIDPMGVVSSSVGDVPPKYREILNCFKYLKEHINNIDIEAVIDECLEGVDKNIQRWINRG